MAKKTVKTQLLLRNDQRSNFSPDKVYGKAEPVVVWETDGTATLLMGDGKTAFKDLTGIGLTKAQAEKLTGIEAGAQVNVIESVSVNGVALEVTEKGVNVVVPTGALASKDKVAEADLADDLKAKVNASAEGNHSHSNKDVLDGVTAEKVTAWDGAATATTTLVGDDTGKSARAIASEELAKQLIPDTAKESMNTLAEIAAWIQAHPDDAAAINSELTAVKDKVTALENVGATKVEESETNGNIKIDGAEVEVYTLPDTVLDSSDTIVFDCGTAAD